MPSDKAEHVGRMIYLSHPQVAIDPNVPVPDWGLSPEGAARVANWVSGGLFHGCSRIICSAERKAIDTARPIADSLGLSFEIREAMHENDRSATGFLPPEEFQRVADEFFAKPEHSVRGWETARAAQRRIRHEADEVIAGHGDGDLLLVGHGGVGTLLWCDLAGLEIDRSQDQGGQGGSIWAVSLPDLLPVHRWVQAESLMTSR